MAERVSGLYQLVIGLRCPAVTAVGALGRCHFPAGWYVYTGSARSGLVQRVGRHLQWSKRRYWHIDYLLAMADEVEAFVLPGSRTAECALHGRLVGGRVVVDGFGSSDCMCVSHLAYFTGKPKVGLMRYDAFAGNPRSASAF
jgi:sugar fermentation stimulation protein A